MLPERGVAVVGAVPAGLPGLQVPLIPVNKIPDVLFAGAALGFVGLAQGLSAARLFAVKGGYRVDTDQELMAGGVGCLGCGLVGGLAVAGSLSKTRRLPTARAARRRSSGSPPRCCRWRSSRSWRPRSPGSPKRCCPGGSW